MMDISYSANCPELSRNSLSLDSWTVLDRLKSSKCPPISPAYTVKYDRWTDVFNVLHIKKKRKYRVYTVNIHIYIKRYPTNCPSVVFKLSTCGNVGTFHTRPSVLRFCFIFCCDLGNSLKRNIHNFPYVTHGQACTNQARNSLTQSRFGNRPGRGALMFTQQKIITCSLCADPARKHVTARNNFPLSADLFAGQTSNQHVSTELFNVLHIKEKEKIPCIHGKNTYIYKNIKKLCAYVSFRLSTCGNACFRYVLRIVLKNYWLNPPKVFLAPQTAGVFNA